MSFFTYTNSAILDLLCKKNFHDMKKIYALLSKVSLDDATEVVVDVMICDMRSNNDLSMWQNMNLPNFEYKLNKMNSCV